MNTTTNTRGVSEAMVERVSLAIYARAMESGKRLEPTFCDDLATAALCAEPAAQGDADLAGYVDPEQVADMQRNGGGVSIGSFSERYGRTVPVYFRPAPPAQPAERVPEGLLRKALSIAANIRTTDWLEAGGTVREQDALAAYLTASPAPSDGGKGVEG